jgi:3-dehydroquinate dehydratase II
MTKILILNGPNLNLLGSREPEIYGSKTLEQINEELSVLGSEIDLELDFFQSNSESELMDKIQVSPDTFDAVIFNPAAFTHTSVALADAVAAINIPVIEVHLSNIQAREEFRAKSYISPVAAAVISGFGSQSYELALRGVRDILEQGGR